MEEKDVVICTDPGKKWYASKTLWINAIAIAAIVIQTATGKEILDTDTQSALLGLINIALRLVTKEALI